MSVAVRLSVECVSGEGFRTPRLPELNQVSRQSKLNVAALRSNFENSLVDRHQRIVCTLAHHLFHDGFVLGDGFVEQLLLSKQLCDLHAAGGVARIEGRHLAQQFESFGLLAVRMISIGRGLKCADGFGVETHSLIQLGQGYIRGIAFAVEI